MINALLLNNSHSETEFINVLKKNYKKVFTLGKNKPYYNDKKIIHFKINKDWNPKEIGMFMEMNIKKLSDEVDHGLYEIKIDDSTTILLYRGVESCTMIKK